MNFKLLCQLAFLVLFAHDLQAQTEDNSKFNMSGINSLSLQLSGDAQNGIKEQNTTKDWSSSHNGEQHSYNLSLPTGQGGDRLAEKIVINLSRQNKYVIINGLSMLTDKGGTLKSKEVISTNVYQYYSSCAQVTDTQKKSSKLKCSLVTSDLCEAYQQGTPDKMKVNATEFGKNKERVALALKRKKEAIEGYHLSSAANLQQLGVTLPTVFDYSPDSLDMVADIKSCEQMNLRRGNPEYARYPNPYMNAVRAAASSAPANSMAPAVKASGAGR